MATGGRFLEAGRILRQSVGRLGWPVAGMMAMGMAILLARDGSLKPPHEEAKEEWMRPAESGAETDGSDVEMREGRMAALALAEENAKLQQALGEARRQARELSRSLAAVRFEADDLRTRATRREVVDAGRQTREGEALSLETRVRDVNRELNVVVLEAGAVDGVRPGMEYRVARDGRTVARVRIVDVRDRLSGATIEDVRSGETPQPGDQALPWKSVDR